MGQEVFDRRLSEGEGLAFVATLNAETLDSLNVSYFCLARHLGITEYALTNLAVSTKGESRKKIQDLKRFITPKMKQFSYWLIIINNVVDLPSVHCYLPSTGSEEWGYGQVQAEEFIKAKIQKSSLISYVFDDDYTFTYFRVHNVIYEVLKSVTMCGRDLTYITECLSVSITIFHSLIEANKNLLHASGQVCVKLDKITHHCRQLYLFFTATFTTYTELLDKGLSHLITLVI